MPATPTQPHAHPFLSRERSFSAPFEAGEAALAPPPFACPPVVFPSGSYSYSPSSLPPLSDIEQRLLRGMTLSLSMYQQTAAVVGDQDNGRSWEWEVTASAQDCDCWLGYDKEDGFIFSVWNYTTGNLHEVCMSFVTHLDLSSCSSSEGGDEKKDVLTLTCSLIEEESEEEEQPNQDQLLPPPPASNSIGSSSVSVNTPPAPVLAIRFLLCESASPSADKFQVSDLHAVLQAAREGSVTMSPPAPAADSTSTSDTPSSRSGSITASPSTKQKKRRASVQATSSKRVSLLLHGGAQGGLKDSITSGSSGSGRAGGQTSSAAGAEGSSVSSLIQKFSTGAAINSSSSIASSESQESVSKSLAHSRQGQRGGASGIGGLGAAAQCGSMRNIFGGMEEVDEEDEVEEGETQK